MDLCQDSFVIFTRDLPAYYTSTLYYCVEFRHHPLLGKIIFSPLCVLQFTFYSLPSAMKPTTDVLFYQCCGTADPEGISVQ